MMMGITLYVMMNIWDFSMRIFEELNVVPQTKSEVSAIASSVVDKICEEGTVNVLDAEIMLKQLQNVIECIRSNENYKNSLEKELGRYNEDKFTYQRFSFSKSKKTTYDYKGDSTWRELDAKRKSREELLKTIKEPMGDTNTGEMVYPAIKNITNYVTLKPLE